MDTIAQGDWIGRWAQRTPQKTAVRDLSSGQSASYAELDRLASALAQDWLHSRAFAKGDRIAVLAPMGLPFVCLFAAAQKTGLILVPLNYRLQAGELDAILADAEPRLLLHSAEYSALAASLRWPQDARELLLLPQGENQNCRSLTAPPGEEDPIFLLYTSGSTGQPKGVLYTHKMLLWNSINTALSLQLNSDTRTLSSLPPFHTGGWNVLVTPVLHHGGTVALQQKFDAPAFLRALEEESVTLFMLVPTMMRMLADCPAFDSTDLGAVLYAIVGGEPMPLPLIDRWHKKGVPVRQGYGLTEVGPNLTSLHQDDAIRKIGSIGKPNFYTDIRIVTENGGDAGAGECGELWLKGPMVTKGYWKQEALFAEVYAGGWFRTGDLVTRDAEGYLYIVDRLKNMYISGGENIYPAEIEKVLLRHPDIQEAAIIGVPSQQWGECGIAYLVSRSDRPQAEGVLDYLRLHIAAFKVPKGVFFVEALPLNGAGKIDRQALKRAYQAWQEQDPERGY